MNIYNFLDKKNIEYKKVFLQHFSNNTYCCFEITLLKKKY